MSLARTCLLSFLCAFSAQAQSPDPGVRLTLDQYEALMRDAQSRVGGPAVTWSRAEIEVQTPDEDARFLRVALEARLVVVGKGDARAALLPADVVVQSVLVDGREAALTRQNGAHVLALESSQRSVSLEVVYLVPLSVDRGGRSSMVPLPPLSGATLRVDGGVDRVQVTPAGPTAESGDDLVVTLPATPAVSLRFDAASGAIRVRHVDYEVRVDADGDGAALRATFSVRSDTDHGRVRLAPAAVALVSARGPEGDVELRIHEGWHEATIDRRGDVEITADVRVPVDRSSGQPRVNLTLDNAPITRVRAIVPGKRQIDFEPAAPLEMSTQGEGEAEATVAEAFLPPSGGVAVSWTETRPAPEDVVRTSTHTTQLVSIEEGVVRSRVHVGYQVLRGSVRTLALQIPEGAVLYRVSGTNIDDWRTFAATDDEPRRVQVTLAREQGGEYGLVLDLEQVVATNEGAPLAVPVVRPLGAFRETGVVAMFDGDKVGFAPVEPQGYRKVGQDALPVSIRQGLEKTVTQAYEHIGEPKAIATTISEVVARETLYDARVSALYTVKEGAVIVSATVEVEVKSGKTERLLLSFPEQVTILSVTAPRLSKKGLAPDVEVEEGRKAYELQLGEALEGAMEAHIEFEWLPQTRSGALRLPDVRVIGAEVEEGAFGITAETGIEVQDAAAEELRKVDAADLPDSVRRRAVGGSEILLGYTWAHAPWSLDLDVKRHETVETLEAMVRSATLETTVFEDGHVVTRAAFQVENDQRQFLRLTLPKGAKVWRVSADGQPIKAVSDESGAVAIPLRRGTGAHVEITWQARRDSLGVVGGLDFVAPLADVVVTDLTWTVRIPRQYQVHNIDTALRVVDEGFAVESALASTAPVALPSPETVRILQFRLPVQEPGEAAATLAFRYLERPDNETGTVLWILGVVLLGLATFQRAVGRPMGPRWIVLLVFGVACVTARAVGWGVDDAEAFGTFVTVLAAGIAGVAVLRRQRRREELGL